MNEVSIIINGVRYDYIETDHIYPCALCEFNCTDDASFCKALGLEADIFRCFKKSTKSFER